MKRWWSQKQEKQLKHNLIMKKEIDVTSVSVRKTVRVVLAESAMKTTRSPRNAYPVPFQIAFPSELNTGIVRRETRRKHSFCNLRTLSETEILSGLSKNNSDVIFLHWVEYEIIITFQYTIHDIFIYYLPKVSSSSVLERSMMIS